MTIRSLSPYHERLSNAIRRIWLALKSLWRLLRRAQAIETPVIDGEPKLVRDLEFVAEECEHIVATVRQKIISDDTDG